MKPPATTPFSNPLPNERQLLLLKGILLPGDEGMQAWHHWRGEWDPQEYLDHGSFRLLPMLFRRLASEQIHDPEILKLKGIYRQAWVKNNTLFHQACNVLEWLRGQAIPAMLLKGIPLSILYYRDHGARPMSDMDILIPASSAKRCIELMLESGWHPEYPEYIPYNLKHGRSMMFRNQEGTEADIHWYPLFESVGAGRDQGFWTDAVPMKLHNTLTLAPGPAYMLLHTLIHGMKWNPEPPIRWIPDAMMIIRSREMDHEWGKFTILAKQYRVILTVQEALTFLTRHFTAPIPTTVMETLNRVVPDRAQRIIHHFDKMNPADINHGFRDRLHVLLVTYLRQSSCKGLVWQMPGFVWFLLFRTKGKSRAQILWYYLVRRLKAQKISR